MRSRRALVSYRALGIISRTTEYRNVDGARSGKNEKGGKGEGLEDPVPDGWFWDVVLLMLTEVTRGDCMATHLLGGSPLDTGSHREKGCERRRGWER